RRGAVPACKNRSAAPLTAPCFVHWTRSLFVPPQGEPSVRASNPANGEVRRRREQVCLTTARPPPTGVHLPRPVGEVAQDAQADCDGEGNRQASLKGKPQQHEPPSIWTEALVICL